MAALFHAVPSREPLFEFVDNTIWVTDTIFSSNSQTKRNDAVICVQ